MKAKWACEFYLFLCGPKKWQKKVGILIYLVAPIGRGHVPNAVGRMGGDF